MLKIASTDCLFVYTIYIYIYIYIYVYILHFLFFFFSLILPLLLSLFLSFLSPFFLLPSSFSSSFFFLPNRFSLDCKQKAKISLRNTPDWGVSSVCISPSDTLAFTMNIDGYAPLFYIRDICSVDHSQPVFIHSVPETSTKICSSLTFHAFRPALLGCTVHSPVSPADVYTVNLLSTVEKEYSQTSVDDGEAKGKVLGTGSVFVRWTESEVAGLNRTQFVAPTLHRYASFDGRQIPFFLYSPSSSSSSSSAPLSPPFPCVIHIHGGPESQSRPTYSSLYQYLVSQGISVAVPNVRGSTGYGKVYQKLDNGPRRIDSTKDIGSLLEWMEQQPERFGKKIVYGGSYGGYMVLSSMIHYGDRLVAGCESVGISNFVTFLESTQEYRRNLRRQIYGDERDPEMRKILMDVSPLTHAHKINKPMLICQGARDPRVPQTESMQIVSAIREKGVYCGYVVAEDEGMLKRRRGDWY